MLTFSAHVLPELSVITFNPEARVRASPSQLSAITSTLNRATGVGASPSTSHSALGSWQSASARPH